MYRLLLFVSFSLSLFADIYRNNLNNREFGKETPQNLDSERVTIPEWQGASENQDCGVKPTPPKTDSSGCFGILDVEILPFLRTMQYRKDPYDKIMIFSGSRTGSSVVYNIFRFLFEEEHALRFVHNEFRMDRSVLKTHRIQNIEFLQKRPENTLYVVTIRNPIHACLSTYRIRTPPVDNVKKACQRFIERQIKYFTFISQLQASGCPIVILRYEDFAENPAKYLADFIESYFHLSLSETDRQLLEGGYSRENISANIQPLIDFKEVLPISGFHGKHVPLELWTAPEEVLYWIHHFYTLAKPLFQKYGY